MHAKTLTALATALLLAACQDSPEDEADTAKDPAASSAEVEQVQPPEQDEGRATIEAVLREHFDPALGEVRYFLGWQDLDGDAVEEAIVHVTGPMGCGTGGCDTLILQRDGGNYRVVSVLPTTELPIRLGEDASQGWQDLLVTRHEGETARSLRLTFDGSEYVEADADPDAPGGAVLIDTAEPTAGTSLFETGD